MNIRTKALLFQILCFAVVFIPSNFLIGKYTNLEGLWVKVTAFVVATLICPVFQVVRTKDGDKMFMKWLFLKGIREIK